MTNNSSSQPTTPSSSNGVGEIEVKAASFEDMKALVTAGVEKIKELAGGRDDLAEEEITILHQMNIAVYGTWAANAPISSTSKAQIMALALRAAFLYGKARGKEGNNDKSLDDSNQ